MTNPIVLYSASAQNSFLQIPIHLFPSSADSLQQGSLSPLNKPLIFIVLFVAMGRYCVWYSDDRQSLQEEKVDLVRGS